MYRGLVVELPNVKVEGNKVTINGKPYRKALTKFGASLISTVASRHIDKQVTFLVKAQVLHIENGKAEIQPPVFDTEFYGIKNIYIMANGKHIRTTRYDKAPIQYVAELREEIENAIQKLIDYGVFYYDMTSLGYEKGDLI